MKRRGTNQNRSNTEIGSRLRFAPLVVMAVSGLLLSACGGGASVAVTKPSHGVHKNSTKLKSLESSITSGSRAIFKATYSSTSGDGSTPQTITIERDPPMSVFGSSGESVIDTGHGTYMCGPDSSSGAPVTICENLGSSNPMAGLMDMFNPTAIVGELQSVQGGLAERIAGYSITTSSKTYAGQPSTCVKMSIAGSVSTYCVTEKGILSYVGSSGSVMQLTSFTSTVSASDFALPQGATMMTIPGASS